ncbi:hypothetical protein B0I37DRAFT_344153 [Chaetomium sp. MPI-CAGE-AT-0009]|nr:hypothetical protein B0I37DRAFT_344153 [Chaetomium sp. MPI-CAGE-AT-0009]
MPSSRRSRRAPSAAVDDGASTRSRRDRDRDRERDRDRDRDHHSSSHHHRQRPPSPRHSLRSQFATTRQEYDFGFDDASSSILERSTLASEAVHGHEVDDAGAGDGGTARSAFSQGSAGSRDYYELLCLPRGPSLSPDQVWEAAHRLAQVLAVNKQPPRLQGPAAFHMGLVQAAVETLIDPSRRLGYDLARASKTDSDSDEEGIYGDSPDSGTSESYETRLQEQYLLLAQRESRAGTDLSLRLDATSLVDFQRGLWRPGSGPEIMDISLQKTACTSVPALRRPIERAAMFIQNLGPKKELKSEGAHYLRLTDPTVTVTASAHGLLEPFKLAPLLHDRYQPPGPPLHGRKRVEQLLTTRFLPFLSLNFRQELFWQPVSYPITLPKLVIEQELEVLPQPSTTTRIGQSINLFSKDAPLNVEISARKLLSRRSELLSNVGLAVHQRIGPGTAFFVADVSDWGLITSKECRELFRFSKLSGGLKPIMDAFRNPPTVEIGYAFGRHDLGMPSDKALTKPAKRGLTSLDSDVDEQKRSALTISTGLGAGKPTAYLRYGRDLFADPNPAKPSANPQRRTTKAGGFRAEAELATTTQHDFFLAFRALKRVGRFSKAGLEVGLSPSSLQVSLYWSRLNQRISLPLLTTTTVTTTTTTKSNTPIPPINHLLLTTLLLPLTAFSAWEAYTHLQHAKQAAATNAVTTQRRQRQLAAHVAARRAEADELTVALAAGVGPRQAAARKRGGLVVVSAKYGVRGAPPDEGRLLGFWDPAPGRVKVLRVVYLWEGKEKVVEVSGREELRLP